MFHKEAQIITLSTSRMNNIDREKSDEASGGEVATVNEATERLARHSTANGRPERGVGIFFAWLVAGTFGSLLAFLGCKAVITQSLTEQVAFRGSSPWFSRPLYGSPAVIAGLSLICAAACFFSVCVSFDSRSRTRWLPWLFAAAWFILMVLAQYLS